MSPSPQLAPAGSSSYSSGSMVVGDGTWDTERNTFLLPNLVGLNFDTMRYNGMGNRFREMPQYYSLILAHGILAAITFLLLIPVGIMISRFYTRVPRRAQRYHSWLSTLAMLLATVVIILGFIAVGPERSLSNPHHGIGVAIYVLMIVQVLGGLWVRRKERKRRPAYEPLSYMLHNWLGRATALLGLVQIPLGLTLYGSPRWLFVLYTLAAFLLLFIYFVQTHRQEKHGGYDYDSDYYGPGSAVEERRHSSGISGLIKAGAAGVGIAALANRFRNRSRSPSRSRPEVVGSRRHSRSDFDDGVDEKYSQYGRDPDRRGGKWRDRLLAVGAIGGAAALANKYFGRRDRDRDSDVGDYGPPLGGATAINPGPSNRLDEGRPLPSNQHPLNAPLQHRRSTSSMSYSDYMSASQEGRGGHGLRNAVAGLGALGLARNIFKKRRERKEQKRLEDLRRRELEDERRNRANGQRFTGDGFPQRGGRRGSLTTSSSFTDGSDDRPRRDPGLPPPVPTGAFPLTAGTVMTEQDRERLRQGPPVAGAPLPPPPPAPGAPVEPVAMPAIPPDPQSGGIFHQESSNSSIDGRHHRRRRSGRNSMAAAVGTAAAAGAVAAGESSRRRDHRHSASGGEGSVASPPVSVKVKMHSDGRHVTLRRLPQEEAAAERAARRQSKDRHGRRRAGSVSTLSGTDGNGDRWRRAEATERQQAEQMRIESERIAAARAHQAQAQAQPQQSPVSYPPPPPIPSSSTAPPPPTGPGSVGSPGNYDTEASADYANNRRRRRAERAQAKQAREARGQNVEFT